MAQDERDFRVGSPLTPGASRSGRGVLREAQDERGRVGTALTPGPFPPWERGSFDRLRMNGMLGVGRPLSHWGRGSFDRLRMNGGRS